MMNNYLQHLEKSLTFCRNLKFCGWPVLKHFTGVDLKDFVDMYAFAEKSKNCEPVCLWKPLFYSNLRSHT